MPEAPASHVEMCPEAMEVTTPIDHRLIFHDGESPTEQATARHPERLTGDRHAFCVWMTLASGLADAAAATYVEPTVYASSGGVLDLLVIAQQTSVTGIDPLLAPGYAPAAWSYQVCYRPAQSNTCPPGTDTPYAGVRLALQPGDLLKMRFINNLPPVRDGDLERETDDPLLKLNPSNIHTHGLIVDATPNTAIPPAVPVYGDSISTPA
eukprot:gene23405-24844_t